MLAAAVAVLLLPSCAGKNGRQTQPSPWGEKSGAEESDDAFDLDRILSAGEMIMLTVTGSDTYYDWHGSAAGLQYMLCRRFADVTGVRLRVELCRDTVETLDRLLAGEGDIAALPLSAHDIRRMGFDDSLLAVCAPDSGETDRGWVTVKTKPQLTDAIRGWYDPATVADVRKEETALLREGPVRRKVYSPMLDRGKGVISRYDDLFKTYCREIRWDWRLMAAQCYQESTFDPQAQSWAGACGLMQIMPATAREIGLPQSQIYDPESNIAAAAKLLAKLEDRFADVADRQERLNFVLASYNGGFFHIRDAMALAERDGKDKYCWDDVAKYVLALSNPEYYLDSLVKYGYMRGQETVDYVERVNSRWQQYRGVKTRNAPARLTPQRATKQKKKYQI